MGSSQDEDEDSSAALPHLITPQGYQQLLAEFDKLYKVERPKVVDEVHHAALQGDRSENAEYIYGKRRLREIDRRLRFLKRQLDSARIKDPARQTSAIIEFGAVVTLRQEEGQVVAYQLIGEHETDPSSGKISWKSPIGRSLIGRKAGDIVVVQTPKGELEFEIVTFKYPGDV